MGLSHSLHAFHRNCNTTSAGLIWIHPLTAMQASFGVTYRPWNAHMKHGKYCFVHDICACRIPRHTQSTYIVSPELLRSWENLFFFPVKSVMYGRPRFSHVNYCQLLCNMQGQCTVKGMDAILGSHIDQGSVLMFFKGDTANKSTFGAT